MAQLFKTKGSTIKKIAELPRFRHPGDLLNLHTRPIAEQNKQINGQLEFGKGEYFLPAQEKLVQNLIQTRAAYRTASSSKRLEIASQQYTLWNNYISAEVQALPESYRISDAQRQKLYEGYLVGKQRQHEKQQLSRVLRALFHLSHGHTFDIRLHPIVLLKLVHPHYGYLNNYQDVRLKFDDFVALIEENVAISKVLEGGSTLHSMEMLSFMFWKLTLPNGYAKFTDFSRFLKRFKFDVPAQEIEEEFSWTLKGKNGELHEDEKIVRFDLWRNIFLDRGL